VEYYPNDCFMTCHVIVLLLAAQKKSRGHVLAIIDPNTQQAVPYLDLVTPVDQQPMTEVSTK